MPRPKSATAKLTYGQKEEVKAAFAQYIADHDDPIIAGFCALDPTALKYWVTKDNMNDWPEMQSLMKRAVTKSEYYLNTIGAKEMLPMAIFRLKQPYHGYRDRFEQDITSNGQRIVFNNKVPRAIDEKPKLKRGHRAGAEREKHSI